MADTNQSFNLADTVQSGIKFLTSSISPYLRQVGMPALVMVVVFTALEIMTGYNGDRAMLRGMTGNGGWSEAMISILAGILNIGLSLCFVAFLAMSAYRMAAGLPKPDYAWRLGSAEPPLIGIHRDEGQMMAAVVKRIGNFWPLFVAAILFGIGQSFSSYAEMQSFGSRYGGYSRGDGTGASIIGGFFWLLGWVFVVMTLWVVTRRFLFMAPVIGDTGTADKARIAAPIPGRFPRGLTSQMFLKSAALMLIAYLPVWLTGWLIEAFFAGASNDLNAYRNSYDPFINFLLILLTTAATVIAVGFFGGALAAVWRRIGPDWRSQVGQPATE